MSFSERIVKRTLSIHLIRRFYTVIARVLFYGKSHRCVVCKSNISVFLPKRRQPWRCPVCFSEPRHRLAWLYLEQDSSLFVQPSKNLLHIAPELCLMDAFKKYPSIQYVSGDKDSSLAMVKMDLTKVQYEDNSFDIIYCSHVLEHIREDIQAMKEMFRILRPGGWAIIMVPVSEGKTRQRPAPGTPEAKLFSGHPGHVRQYGDDFQARLQSAGFSVAVHSQAQKMCESKRKYYGLTDEKIFVCLK